MSQKYPVNAPCPCGSEKKYKKCCGSPLLDKRTPLLREATLSDPKVVAYSDETGNSGNELFDPQQPIFWTGTLVTGADMQVAAAEAHAECLRVTGHKELHGNALGLRRIDAIADKLIALFSATSSMFFFTQVEKMHLAGTKFADTLLDSGNNQAMSLLQYGPRASRLPLALQLIQVLDENDCREFWDAFAKNDSGRFAAFLGRILKKLEGFHEKGIYHDRTAQLLGDALRWGMKYPGSLLERGLHPLDSPNVVAFTLIISMFHHLFERSGARVRTFIHDEQNEFAKYLFKSYDLLKGFAFEQVNIVAPLPDVKKTLTFGCKLQVANSKDCIGLQLIDVALWLTKRYVDTRGAVHGRAGDLAVFIIKNAMISSISRDQLIKDTQKVIAQLEALPISKEQEIKARKILAELEEKRIARMNAPLELD